MNEPTLSPPNPTPAFVPKPADPIKISTLAELDQLCQANFDVEFSVHGRQVQVQARHLTPAESARLQLLLSEAIPPIIRATDPGQQDRYDMENPEYVKKSNQMRRKVRALSIWLACPIFRQEGLDEKDPDKIVDLVQGKCTEEVLQFIYAAVLNGPVTVGEYLNFSSAASSPPS